MGRLRNFLSGGGGNLIGGVLNMVQNRRFMNESYEREDTQLQRMVEDARAAGISPVAALGASGAYSATANVKPETSGDLIGAGLADVFGERAELENDLLRAQIGERNASAAALAAEARSRSLMGAARAAAREEPGAYDPRANALFDPGGVREPEVGIELGGLPVVRWSDWTAAETAEEIFGEPGEWIQGVGNLARYLGEIMFPYRARRELPGRVPTGDRYGIEFNAHADLDRHTGDLPALRPYPWDYYRWYQ